MLKLKNTSKLKPVSLPSDPPELRDKLEYWQSLGLAVFRPTKYQIKIATYNFYPRHGTITIDGEDPYADTGLVAFEALLEAAFSNEFDRCERPRPKFTINLSAEPERKRRV